MTFNEIKNLLWRWFAVFAPGILQNRAIRECTATLPVMRGHLLDASRQVETAVNKVCGSFQAIADRSRQSVEKAREMLGTDHEASVGDSLKTSEAAISNLLQRVEQCGELASVAIQRMEEIESSVVGMASLLEEVEKIAFTSKVVALNAKIEAVHVGALGAGFEVVADEISRQAERTGELTKGISSRIQAALQCSHSATASLRTYVAEDRVRSVESRNQAEGALKVLLTAHRQANDSVAMMTTENSRLSDEIAQAIVNLQFQDRLAQRMAHVEEALGRMQDMLTHNEPGTATTDGQSLLDEVVASYSMQEERHVQTGRPLSAMASVAGAESLNEADMSVELF